MQEIESEQSERERGKTSRALLLKKQGRDAHYSHGLWRVGVNAI